MCTEKPKIFVTDFIAIFALLLWSGTEPAIPLRYAGNRFEAYLAHAFIPGAGGAVVKTRKESCSHGYYILPGRELNKKQTKMNEIIFPFISSTISEQFVPYTVRCLS